MSVTIEPTAGPAAADAAIPDVPIYRLTVAQYEAMASAGILTEDDSVELLEGWLVRKMTKNRPHIIAAGLARRALERLIPSGWHVAIQDPIATVDSEPEPDLAVVRGEERDYPDRHRVLRTSPSWWRSLTAPCGRTGTSRSGFTRVPALPFTGS
jgi:hypothetical protein